MAQQRVLVFGQTGVVKKQAIKRVTEMVLRHKYGIEGEPSDSVRRSLVSHVCLEDEIKHLFNEDLSTFLETYNPADLRERWSQAVDNLNSSIGGGEEATVFIELHAHYFWRGRYFSPIDYDKLRELEPSHAVCLIDDMYSIWTRIVAREAQRRDGSYYSLNEISNARQIETMTADAIAQEVLGRDEDYACRCFVLSVRQSPTMLYRLLCEPARARIYASFPISKTRFVEDRRDEINAFRRAVHEEFTVFDPLCIDEKLLQFLLVEHYWWQERPVEEIARAVGFDAPTVTGIIDRNEGQWRAHGREYRSPSPEVVLLQRDDRWSIPEEDSLVGPSAGDRPISFPIELSADEIAKVTSEIDRQIRDRDFRLIHQSEAVAMYRPQYLGEGSKGVFAEYQYTNHSEHKRTFPVFNREEDGDPKEPFGSFPRIFDNTDEMLDALREFQAELANA